MGWNNYNYFGNSVNALDVEAIARAMHVNGMQKAGYIYVNIDDTWQGRRDRRTGELRPSTQFLSGLASMKVLSDYIHSLGLKLGLYTSPARTSCAGNPGSQGHVMQDVETFADWRVDYIKLDFCGAPTSPSPCHKRPFSVAPTNLTGCDIVEQWDIAIRAAKRPMVLSINAGGGHDPRATTAPWAFKYANQWRTGDDICARWFNETDYLPRSADPAHCFDRTTSFGVYDYIRGATRLNAPWVGPTHFADPDMLEVGHECRSGGPFRWGCWMSPEEQRTHFAMWAMWAAPLIAGNNPTTMHPGDIQSTILLNPDVISVDQDLLGKMAMLVSLDNSPLEVWAKPLTGKRMAIFMVNASGTKPGGGRASSITFTFREAGLSPTKAYRLRDLYTHRSLRGRFRGSYTSPVLQPHDSLMLIVS